MRGFFEAIDTSDVESLTRLLTQDVVVYGDGGGKAPITPRPITGREAVVKFLLRVYRLLPADTRIVTTHVNGSPGLLFRVQDRLLAVVTFYLYRQPDQGHL